MFYHICFFMGGHYLQFQHQNAVLGYLQAGNGPEHLFIFHGFGQDHTVFNSLVDGLSEKYTLYVFDLFFHGNSFWPHGEAPMSKDYWKRLLGQFLIEKKIESFSVMGYSLGSKFAFTSLEAFPQQISNVYLLAPDGIKTNIWYSLATYPIVLRRLFKSMILKPGRFQSIINLTRSLKLIDRGVIKFAESQMDTTEKRKRVYFSWVVFRRLQFNMKTIATLINTHKISLYVMVGRYDKIITAKNMKGLLKRVPGHYFQILNTGHNGVIEKSIEVIRNIATKSP